MGLATASRSPLSLKSRQLLLQQVEPIFISLVRRPALNHASDTVLLLSQLAFQLFNPTIEILRHTPQR
jgi:hypothetical protein